ncbi:hypothetical protein VKT23_001200 [Stygiomarasmius scandens]|uniref:Uncharacterized protein n=1 Tax=Marasmiellus scandens TaxID=2682957 RepID=A0ABR1K6E6_9AGAR
MSNKPIPPQQVQPATNAQPSTSTSASYTPQAHAAQNNAGSSTSTVGSQSYYDATGAQSQPWKSWSMTTAYPYSTPSTSTYPHQYSYTHFRPQAYPTATQSQLQSQQPQSQTPSVLPKPASTFVDTQKGKEKAKSPSLPPPPSPYVEHWDTAVKVFLEKLGLTQALRGFELDMLTMNEEHERTIVPDALDKLVKNIEELRKKQGDSDLMNVDEKSQSLEERKLEHVSLPDGTRPQPPSTINKSISSFLASKRAHNDISNRTEFLRSLAEKRASMPDPLEAVSSCARADAKVVNRDVQMKYDIAKNEDGPLRRTVKLSVNPPTDSGASTSTSASDTKGKDKVQNTKKDSVTVKAEDSATAEQHPGLDERLTNIEEHFAVRYVPSPPRNLLDRLQFLENHIIRLEKEYPPWAALHFNQPNRSWPPAPRSTPIIVPSHLTDSSKDMVSKTGQNGSNPSQATSSGVPKGRKDSSLHRAVLERLEIQNAKNDLNTTGR